MALRTADVIHALPRLPEDVHKYTRGVLGLSTGTDRYPGAAVLGASAALMTGVGMIRQRGPQAVTSLVLARHPEVVVETRSADPGRCQAWVVGSGMEDDGAARLELTELAAACREHEANLIIDAGALNALADPACAEALEGQRERTCLTPHAGELELLLKALGQSVTRTTIEGSPSEWAEKAAELTGCTVLLKGPTTHVAAPGADTVKVRSGHPWLATAGSGDVLAGVLGALAATSTASLQETAAAAAWIHGRAGALAAVEGPFGASVLPTAIRRVMKDLYLKAERA